MIPSAPSNEGSVAWMLVRDLARLLLEARYYNKQWLILQKLCVVLLTQAFIKENQVNLGVTKEILSKELPGQMIIFSRIFGQVA